MPDYNLTDAVVLPFTLIPAVLVVLLLWGTDRAGRRLVNLRRHGGAPSSGPAP